MVVKITMINKVTYAIAKYGSLLWLMLLPIQKMLIAVIVLTFIDMVVGIWASVKEGYKVTSRSLRRTLSKICVYQLSIIVAFLIETYMLDYPLTKAVTGLIGVIEGKSFFENLYRITKVDFLKIIIDKLQLVHTTLSSSKDENETYRGKRRNEKED